MTQDKDKKLIAIIEDDEVLLKLLKEQLEKAGYEVITAIDGVKGLELVRSKKPDLLLLDIIIPRKDGFQVLSELKKENIIPALPVVVVSNSGQPVEIDRAINLGVRDYLIKLNFNPYEVLEKIKKILG